MNARTLQVPMRSRGLSLVELMIALALGLLVVAAIIQLFIGSRATYMSNEAVARVQENSRFAMEILKRELRDVGTHGFCAARMEIRNHLNPGCNNWTDAIFDAGRAFVGWEYAGTGRGAVFDGIKSDEDLVPASGNLGYWTSLDADGNEIDLPAFLDGRVVRGSDVLVVRRPEVVPGVTAAGNTPPNANAITTDPNSHGIRENEIVLITNCTTGADLFQNRSNPNAGALSAGSGSCSNPGPGNINNLNWSTAYDDTMQIFRIHVNAYYVGYNATTGEPGLYRTRINQGTANVTHEELVSGVENMQLLYGYSLPAEQGGDGQTVNFWLPADEVPNWEFVIGARVALIVRSPDSMGAGSMQQTFDLISTSYVAPEDMRLRQPFTTSISLRNRQIVM
jgi:type IV pilus assembly protein PilW